MKEVRRPPTRTDARAPMRKALEYKPEEPKTLSLRERLTDNLRGFIGVFAVMLALDNTLSIARNIELHTNPDSTVEKTGKENKDMSHATTKLMRYATKEDKEVRCIDDLGKNHGADGQTALSTLHFLPLSHIYGVDSTIHSFSTSWYMLDTDICRTATVLPGQIKAKQVLFDNVQSLIVALHETAHANGTYDEAEATCEAFEQLPDTLEELGASKAYAHGVAEDVIATIKERTSDDYREYAGDGVC
ncbi:MAG TPA: hypothetical protein VGE34_02190 [Candidatus Saccharimonadales bacterium]